MEKINFVIVFIQGVISFLSPCILPLLPVYLTILARSAETDEESKKSVLLVNTILFILGISTTFFILGNSISFLGNLLVQNKDMILIGGGLLIVIMGLFYTGWIEIPALQKERRLHYQNKRMTPIAAYGLGVVFSFGWTPCIGPMLTSVLIMASSAKDVGIGNVLILMYTLGFMVPFLIIAAFSRSLFKYLDRVKDYMGVIQKLGGIILIVTGAVMFLNGINGIRVIEVEKGPGKFTHVEEEEKTVIPAPDFVLTDQYGQTHTLSEYRGKTIFLNFWATWCPPCKAEMPHIEALYNEYGKNQEDVIILGVTFPEYGQETTIEGIKEFLAKEAYTFPTVFDEVQLLAYQYYINAFPTTFIINPEGNIELYVPGAMTKETMKSLIEDTRSK